MLIPYVHKINNTEVNDKCLLLSRHIYITCVASVCKVILCLRSCLITTLIDEMICYNVIMMNSQFDTSQRFCKIIKLKTLINKTHYMV